MKLPKPKRLPSVFPPPTWLKPSSSGSRKPSARWLSSRPEKSKRRKNPRRKLKQTKTKKSPLRKLNRAKSEKNLKQKLRLRTTAAATTTSPSRCPLSNLTRPKDRRKINNFFLCFFSFLLHFMKFKLLLIRTLPTQTLCT